jgi:hypothetical protein
MRRLPAGTPYGKGALAPLRVIAAAVFAFVGFLCVAGSNASAEGSQPARSSDVRPSLHVSTRLDSPATATYSIDDIGSPPAGTYSASFPIGFNNTGQIFGYAIRKAQSDPYLAGGIYSCIVWTGTKFANLEPSFAVTGCSPYAMDSADPKLGDYTVVGTFADIHHDATVGTDAFAAHVDGEGNVKLVPYYDHFPAALFGINASGVGIGYSYSEPLVYTVPPEILTSAQPSACPQTGCIFPIQTLKQLDGEPRPECAFGGCTINDAGVIIATGLAAAYELFTIGEPASLHPVKFPVDANVSADFVVTLNNANQLLYFEQSFVLPNGRPVVAKVYDIATNTATVIPPVTGTSCQHYFPISMNNLGEVLGFTSYCTSRPFYWTWDSVHGTQNLSDAVPASAYAIAPLAVNDNAQILASLTTAAGVTHWGILDPPSAGSPQSRDIGPRKGRHAR